MGIGEVSQVQALNEPAPRSWDDFEDGCLATYAGGHHHDGKLAAFQHGMRTVFNLLRAEFPRAETCKAAPDLLEACEAVLDVLRCYEISGGTPLYIPQCYATHGEHETLCERLQAALSKARAE